jgi:hypothetical protein
MRFPDVFFDHDPKPGISTGLCSCSVAFLALQQESRQDFSRVPGGVPCLAILPGTPTLFRGKIPAEFCRSRPDFLAQGFTISALPFFSLPENFYFRTEFPLAARKFRLLPGNFSGWKF